MGKTIPQLNSALVHILLLLGICLPYCINIGKSSIWDANEAFYAETPREMLVRNDLLAPHFNFEPRAQKPPLTYWLILLSYKIFGIGEFAVRIPSALAAIGIVLFAYGMGRILFSPKAALLSAIITAATARIFILARRLPIDILLLFFLTGTLFFIVLAIQKNRKGSWLFAWLFAALGFLTKGPVALVLPACAYGLWLIWTAKSAAAGRTFLQRLCDARPGIGVPIFLLIVLPWYLLVYRTHGWTYISPFFLRDNFGRFAAESLGPSRSLFYYISVFISDFFPWSFLLVPAAFFIWRSRRDYPLKSLSFGLPAIWCAFVFVLFSFSKNKQEYYIAPIYPAASLLLAGALDRFSIRQSSQPHRAQDGQALWTWTYSAIAILLLLLSSFIPFILSSFMPGISPVLHYGPTLILVAGVLLLIWSITRRDQLRCFTGVAVPLWAVYLLCALLYLPALEPFRPVKSFCRVIEAESRTTDEAGYYGTALPSMAFYLRRQIFEETDREQMLQRFQSEKRVFCILSKKDFDYFADKLKIHILDRHARFAVRLDTVLNAGYYAGDELFLVTNRP